MENVAQTARMIIERKVLVETTEERDFKVCHPRCVCN